MANAPTKERETMVIRALAEGNSIRDITDHLNASGFMLGANWTEQRGNTRRFWSFRL